MNFCHNCGGKLEAHRGSKFCWNCGTALVIEETNEITNSSKSSQQINVNIASLKSILDTKSDSVKYFYRKSFKTRYSDCWNLEEQKLNQAMIILKIALNSAINSRIEEAISNFREYLLIDNSGSSEKISEINMKSFLSSSDGRKYGDLHTRIMNLINELSFSFSSFQNTSTVLPIHNNNQNTDFNSDFSTSIQANYLDDFKSGYDSYGIIFTNSAALADNFEIEQSEVIIILQNYIEKLKSGSHQYIILDASNNCYVNWNPDDTWENHVKLLRDYYNDLESKPEYLFIIGGHNIIPMAIINNQAGCYADDSDIDTDMPYSYLKTENFESLLWNGNIFKENLLLNVGRIPFATDSDIYDLKNYLDRASDNVLTNVQINNCFGITALSWESASEKIIQNANAQKILHTSPQIDINSVDNVYDESAELYYYNLHGSDAPSASQFYGDNGGAVAPKHIAKAVNPNFFITEACYGAKFIDYDKQSSMLHSALNNNTLAFVGSSRVAFGACSSNISSADIVAKSFIDALFDSVNCGKALSKARIDVFDACPDEQYNYGVTSAVEFNLFGDPILKASDSSKSMFRKSSGNTLKNNSIKSKSYTKSKPEIKEIDFQNLEKGILNNVRNLVNNEVLKIREIVDTYLYQNFNVDKRCIQKVFVIKSKFGEETFNYTYQNQKGNIKTTYSIFTDKRGKIKSILTSK